MPLSKVRKCPYCSKNLSGSYCQWCGNLIKRDSPVGQKGTERTDVLTGQEMEEWAKHDVKATTKVTKEKARKKSEEEAARVITDARRQAKQIIPKAKDKDRTHTKKQSGGIFIKVRNKVRERSLNFVAEAKDKVGRVIKGVTANTSKAEQVLAKTRKRTKSEAQENIKPLIARRNQVRKLYEGQVKLGIVSPIEFAQIMKFEEHLHQLPNLIVVYVRGSNTGTEIVVSAEKPIPLVHVLKRMPQVKRVVAEDNIEVTLRSSQ